MQKFKATMIVEVEFDGKEQNDAVAVADSWQTGVQYLIGAGDRAVVKARTFVEPVK